MDTYTQEFLIVLKNVKDILETEPATRTSEKLLVLSYYRRNHDFEGGDYYDILDWFMKKEIPSFSTILQCRSLFI